MNSRVDLINGKVFKALVLFSVPFLFSNLFQQLYNTIDIYIVGNTLNENSVAAIGSCGAIYELLVGFALGVGNGLGVVIARFYGAADKAMIKKAIAHSFVIAIIVTGFVMFVAEFLLYPLLELLKTPSDIIDEAYSYIYMITICIGVMMTYNLFAGILKAMGNSVLPLIFLIISTVINVCLDYLFIVVGGKGIEGAAIATVIAQAISAVLCIVYTFVKYKEYMPEISDYKYNGRLYVELWAQGLSMGLMSSIVSLGTVVLQFAINGLGTLIIAGHTAARKIFAFSTLPITSIGMSIPTFVSQNIGAKKIDRVREGIKYGIVITTVWSFIVAILLIVMSPFLVELISGSNKEEIVTNGVNYLRFNVLFYIPLGALIVLRCSLQGMGQKILPLVSSIIELAGKVIFTFLLIPALAYTGVIISEPVVWCVMAAYLFIAYKIAIRNVENDTFLC